MVKLTVDITKGELDTMEDYIVAWNLCKKHTAVPTTSEDERWRFTQTCKKCIKINKEFRNKMLDLWIKLCRAYDKNRS
jgi:hypothetical protein